MKETSITKYINPRMPDIWQRKSSSLKMNMEIYKERAILSIYDNAQLMQVSKTEAGLAKIIMCINDAAMMGISFGGQFPQCEIVGFVSKDKPNVYLNIRPAGYKHMVKNSSNPILKDFIIKPVFDGEDFKIDMAGGKVEHSWDGKKKIGKLINVYGIMTTLDGEVVVDYMTREQIEHIRDNYSQTYIHKKSGAWVKSFDQMAIKTAAKQFLKPYAEEKEGREIALAMREDQDPDIENRMSNHLDNISENSKIVEGEIIEETKKEEPKNKKKDGEKNENEKPNQDDIY